MLRADLRAQRGVASLSYNAGQEGLYGGELCKRLPGNDSSRAAVSGRSQGNRVAGVCARFREAGSVRGAGRNRRSCPTDIRQRHDYVGIGLEFRSLAEFTVQPDEIGMRETKTIYLIVSDAVAVHESAKAAGAEMVLELAEMPYGGKAFTCRDPEGHIWSIGEYDPWA